MLESYIYYVANAILEIHNILEVIFALPSDLEVSKIF